MSPPFATSFRTMVQKEAPAGSVLWETAADWDGAASESGVVHESTANTDHDDATIVKQGYPAASPLFSTNLLAYYPGNEDSGSTMYDFSGNNNDASVTGATPNVTGPLGTSAWSYDGTDDYAVLGELGVEGLGEFSIAIWAKWQTNSNNQFMIVNGGSGGNDTMFFGTDSGVDASNNLHASINSDSIELFANIPPLDTYEHQVLTHSASNNRTRIYQDGTQTASVANSVSSLNSTSETFKLGGRGDQFFADIDTAYLMFFDTELSSSDVQTLYDVVNTAGNLTTGWQSLDAAATQLKTTSTIPANTSVDVTVEQDLSSDGTVDNSQTVSLSGGTDETNSLSGFSSSAGRYRVVLAPDQTDTVSASTIDSAEVSV